MKKTTKLTGLILMLAIVASLVLIFGISASAASATVQYVDENGESKVLSNVESLTGTVAAQTLNSGWYVFNGNTTVSGLLTINGDVHIIIADGATVTSRGFFVPYGSSITFYGQSSQSGTLNNSNEYSIGGHAEYASEGCGDITINGANISASGPEDGAAIGSHADNPIDKIGNITINAGNITASNMKNSAAIGYNSDATNGHITINGGNIKITTNIYGNSRSYAVGLGSEQKFAGITINGGVLDVFGDSLAIGGAETPITINGGRIKAKTHVSGAAIGSPYLEDAGPITITGGYIEGIIDNSNSEGAAVIGGGSGALPASINISGGTLVLTAYAYGIGANETYYGANNPYDFILTGGSIYVTSTMGKQPISKKAVFKNANGESITPVLTTLTLTDSGTGTRLTAVAGSTYGVNDVETKDNQVFFYLDGFDSLPTKIYTSKGLYLPESEGSTTYALHDVHTPDSVYAPYEEDVELHTEYHPCCDEIEVVGHLFTDGKYVCECGLSAVALVDGTYFVNFDNALREAQKDESSTITLLMNAEIVDDIHINGNITLDLNGFSLITSNKYMYSIYLRTGSLTLKDSSEGKTSSIVPNSANADTIGIENGTLTIESGKYGKIAGTNGTIVVKGGTIADIALTAGTLNIQGGEFGKLSSHTLLQPSLAENLFFYDREGNIVDGRVLTLENVVVKTGADFSSAIATLDINNTTYTGLNKEPGLVLSIFDSVVAAEHYDISYTENILPGEATVTVSAKGIYTGATTATLTISKGYLQVMENPTATHEFGDIYSDKVITGGKVVIVGNEEAVISGKWTWTEGEPKATFVPDESYNGLFEELTESYDVNIIVTAASPALNISAPSLSILPGVDTPISVVAKNPYDEELTEIPVDYKIFYLVGEEGEEVMVEGLVFNLPNTVRLGDKVYLRVENIAVDGKYSVATSNTLVFTVGAIDYSGEIADTKEELNTAIEELKAAIESGEASDEVVAQKLDDLQKRIAEAEELLENLPTDNASKGEVADLKELLEQADTDMGTLIQSLNSSLNSTKEDLDATKDDLDATKGELNATKGELENTKEALEATKADLEATKTDMANRIGAIENEPAPKNTTAVVAVVIAAVSVLGNLALAAYMFLLKRR